MSGLATNWYHYVIYERPRDYPLWFVMRKWVISEGRATATQDMKVCASLEAARRFVPAGLVRIGRSPGDEACIVETWL